MICVHCGMDIPLLGDTCPYCRQSKIESKIELAYWIRSLGIPSGCGYFLGYLLGFLLDSTEAQYYLAFGLGALGFVAGFVWMLFKAISSEICISRVGVLLGWGIAALVIAIFWTIRVLDKLDPKNADDAAKTVLITIFLSVLIGGGLLLELVRHIVSFAVKSSSTKPEDISVKHVPNTNWQKPAVQADIQFQCPLCNQPLEAPEDMAGRSLNCPSCNGKIDVSQRSRLKLKKQ